MLVDGERALLVPGAPRDVQQVGDAEGFEHPNATALVCTSAAGPVMAATMCGTIERANGRGGDAGAGAARETAASV